MMKVFFAALLLISVSASGGTNYYVTKRAGASDANTGTQASPWLTYAKVKATSMTAGDTVFFERGYSWPETWRPLNGNAIQSAYGTGAKPTFTALVTVSAWQPTSNPGVYAVYCPACVTGLNLVTLNGKMQPMARYPNSGWLSINSFISTTKLKGGGFTGTPSYVGATIVTRSSHFTIDRSTITIQNQDTFTFSPAASYSLGQGFFLQGSESFLDQVGEWTFDPVTDSLKVYFGGAPGSNVVQASTMDTLGYYGGGNLTVLNTAFTGANKYNLMLTNTATGNNKVQFCKIAYSGQDNFYANNQPNLTLTDDSIMYALSDGVVEIGTLTTHYTARNYIHWSGMIQGMGQSGAGMTYAGINSPQNGITEFNLIDSTGYNGMYASGQSIVQYNQIYDFCQFKDDGAAIYFWDASTVAYSGYRLIQFNIISRGQVAPGGVPVDSAFSVNGIYLDGKTNKVKVYGNRITSVFSCGIFNHGTNIILDSNTVIGSKYAQIQISEVAGLTITGLSMTRNILSNTAIGQKLVSFTSVANDLASFGVADNNNYKTVPGDNTPFYTKSSVDPGTYRGFASWKSTLGIDAVSTLTFLSPTYKFTHLTGNNGANIISWAPADTTTKKPVFIFIPGNGESSTDTNLVYVNGPLAFFKNNASGGSTYTSDGWRPDFWLVCFQPPSGGPSNVWTNMCMNELLRSGRYNIDTTQVYVTGLSYGALAWIAYLQNVAMTTGRFRPTGMVEMSYTYNYDAVAVKYAVDSMPMWNFGGTADGHGVALKNWTATMAANFPSPSKKFTFYVGGHCCWNPYYNPNYREVFNGVNMNIYEYMLQFRGNANGPVSGGGGPTPPPPNQPPVAKAGLDKNISIGTNTILDGSLSTDPDGVIVSYLWSKISGPTGGTIGSPTASRTLITNLGTVGAYSFQLQVTDNLGLVAKDTIVINVLATIPIKFVPSGQLVQEVSANEYRVMYLTRNHEIYEMAFTGGANRVFKVTGEIGVIQHIGSGQYDASAVDDLGYCYTINGRVNWPVVMQQLTTMADGITPAPFMVTTEGYVSEFLFADSTGQGNLYYQGQDRWNHNGGANSPNLTKIGSIPSGGHIIQIATAEDGPIVLTSEGEVWQFAKNTNVPVKVPFPRPVKAIASGRLNFYLAWVPAAGQPTTSGEPYVWGNTLYLGGNNANVSTPINMQTTWGLGEYIKKITCSDNACSFITVSGKLYGIGNRAGGEVGGGYELFNHKELLTGSLAGLFYVFDWITVDMVTSPLRIDGGRTFKDIWGANVFGFYTIAQESNDSLGGWGRNKAWVLGTATNVSNQDVFPNALDLLAYTRTPSLYQGVGSQFLFTPMSVNAGSDFTADISAGPVTLNGVVTPSTSYSISSYAWRQLSGPAMTIATPTTISTAVNITSPGVYKFILKAIDNNTASSEDTVTATMTSLVVNYPVANAGPDSIFFLPQNSITRTATASVIGGTITGYNWIRVSGPNTPTITGGSTATATFSNLIEGVYIFRVTATDNNSRTGYDEFQVTVRAEPVEQVIIKFFMKKPVYITIPPTGAP